MNDLAAILTLAYRDVIRFVRDRPHVLGTLVFPLLFIGGLGGSLGASLKGLGFNFLDFTFTGVLAETLFLSTALGIISLLEDRENDFSQEIFIAPISRYSIIFGKILGESIVASVQGIVILLFGWLLRVPLTWPIVVALIPTALASCLLGGGFGILLLSAFDSQRAANQIIPFLVFPQFFLAGVFTPIAHLPWYLNLLSIVSPMRYAVDLTRGVFYAGQPTYSLVVLLNPVLNLLIVALTFTAFLLIGTGLFVRRERNR